MINVSEPNSNYHLKQTPMLSGVWLDIYEWNQNDMHLKRLDYVFKTCSPFLRSI